MLKLIEALKVDRNHSVRSVIMEPNTAAQLLANNHGNRKLRKSFVKYLVEQILADHWHFTTDAIAVRVDGTIANGQHRLAAIIEANTAVPVIFCEGVTDDEFKVLDMGVKRTVADALHITAALTADAAIIDLFLVSPFNQRMSVDRIQEIIPFWGPIHETLKETASTPLIGLNNAPVRVGVGVRLAMQENEADYILTQYREMMHSNLSGGMTTRVAALYGKYVRQGGRIGLADRIGLVLDAYRCFDPAKRDQKPGASNRDQKPGASNREALTQEVTSALKWLSTKHLIVERTESKTQAPSSPPKRGRGRPRKQAEGHGAYVQ